MKDAETTDEGQAPQTQTEETGMYSQTDETCK